MSSAVEEMLRWDGPLLMMARVAKQANTAAARRAHRW
jgi:cytochrome P450